MPHIYDDILSDARVKLTEMFNNNFREQGFFGQKWVATKTSKVNKRGKGSILIVTGAMRRSIKSMVRGMAVVFSSNFNKRRYDYNCRYFLSVPHLWRWRAAAFSSAGLSAGCQNVGFPSSSGINCCLTKCPG